MAPIRLLIVEDDRQIAEIQKRFVERLFRGVIMALSLRGVLSAATSRAAMRAVALPLAITYR